MKIDLRYKNAPLFAISIALYLSATTMAEAAPVAVKASNTKRPNNPDEAVRSMTAAQLPQIGSSQSASNFPRPSEIIPSALKKVAQKSPAIVPGTTAPQVTNATATGSINPLDRIVAGITNKSSGQTVPRAIYIPASSQAKAVQPVPRSAATSELSQANLPPLATANVPVSDLPFPDVDKTNTDPAQEQSKATKETFIAQPSADKVALPSNQWANLSGIGSLVSNSKKMVLSIRSDSSALFSMESARLEIPSAFSSRFILGSTVKNSQLPNLGAPDSEILSIQIPRRGNNSAMRLLLTQKGASASEVSTLIVQNEARKSVAFSVIGAHRFSNKPNV
jgi:hypothetical protein